MIFESDVLLKEIYYIISSSTLSLAIMIAVFQSIPIKLHISREYLSYIL